jgi:hypothetical protein
MEVMFIFGLIDGIQIGYFMKSLAIELFMMLAAG